MQVANSGGTSSDAATSGVGVVSDGNDELSDLTTNSNVVQSIGNPSSQTQTQPQQQLRQTSPGQQQQLHQNQHNSQHQQHHASHNQTAIIGSGSNSSQTGSSGGGVHHHHVSQSGGGYQHQRHAQSYHHNQQQHHVQHYHHHHQSKYNQNNPRGGDNESNINHVLLITVINPHYTITCDLIHQICSTYGKVNRIVIFKKNGVQAMVEFDNVESAKRAKSMLYGCDIYSGCCTLKIEFAKPTRLNIHKNDNESFDYTNPNLGADGPPPPPQQQPDDDGAIDDSGLNEQLQISSVSSSHSQPPHHAMQQHSPHGPHQSHGHHPRGSGARGGSGSGGGGGGSNEGHHQHEGGHHHFHPSHHHSHSSNPQHHVQPAIPSHVAVSSAQHGTAGVYGIAAPVDQANNAAETFHQDGGFNVSRGGHPPAAAYVGDSYITAHEGPPAAHGGLQHGNMYSRQDGHHQHPHQQPQHHQHHHHHHQHPQHHHHQQHHTRSGGPNHNSPFSSNATNAMSGPSNLGPPQGAVMMVYGLQPDKVNCDRLFNLFCLYGNVVRVKFLRTKEGCAMVQMGDVLAVGRCVSSLNKITLFGSELQISYSKQAFLHDILQPFSLPDRSPSFKDFMGNKNNRFKNPEVASKNRISAPSQVLHFFNAPFGITEDELMHLFKQTAGHEPISVKIFPPKAENSKSYSGLATFKDPAEATETLVLCNHLNMPKPGVPHPYILRLCFSPPSYMRHPPAYANQCINQQ